MIKASNRTARWGGSAAAAVVATAALVVSGQSATAEISPSASADCEVNLLPGLAEDTKSRALSGDSTGTYAAGYVTDADGTTFASVWENGELTPIEIDGATGSSARDVNSQGDVVGTFRDAEGGSWPFVYSDGEATVLERGDTPHAEVWGINDDGVIAGSIAQDQHNYDAVRWHVDDPATPQTLTAPDDLSSKATTIDNEGNIGGVFDPAQLRPYVWDSNDEGASLPSYPEEDENSTYTLDDYNNGWALAGFTKGNSTITVMWKPGDEAPVELEGYRAAEITGSGEWVGFASDDDGQHTAVTSTPDGDITELPTPDGFDQTSAYAVSEDASVIIGTVDDAEQNKTTGAMWTCGGA